MADGLVRRHLLRLGATKKQTKEDVDEWERWVRPSRVSS